MIYLKHIPDNTPLTLGISTPDVSVSETLIWGNTEQTSITALGGRMNILDVSAPGSVQQYDGKYALDLSAVSAAETRRFTTGDGKQVTMEIAAPSMAAKWGEGTHYQLERDPVTEDLIIEPGRNHRKVYVTNGAHGYTRAEIAAEVGGGMTAAQVTDSWLKAQSVYGASEAKALAFLDGLTFWHSICVNSSGQNPRQSNWLLLEAGYTYDNGNTSGIHFLPPQMEGESKIHPCVITRYGTGKNPIVAGKAFVAFGPKNVVIHRVSIGNSFDQITGDYIIFSDITNEPGYTGINISKNVSYRTLYRCSINDVHRPVPTDGVSWRSSPDHLVGLFLNQCNHPLIEDCFWDHNGWKDGWTMELSYALNPNQPPSIYSHNIYSNFSNLDFTVIGTLSARGASMGMKSGSAARFQDNLFLDNQMQGYVGAGAANYVSNYSLVLRNFFTSASHMKPFPSPSGAFKSGFEIQSKDSTALDNVVAHLADPNNPAELAAKDDVGPFAMKWKEVTPGFDNTIIVGWLAADVNTDGLNMAQVNARTIQTFAATKLPNGTAPTIPNLMAWMKTLTPRQRQVITREALDYLRAPYDPKLEMSVSKRTTPAVCVFRPDPRGEGFLWDNPLNWSTGDLPGTVAGDTVDLHGNFVRFGRLTVSVPINFNGGRLDVVSGKLTCTAQTGVADVTVRNSGQYVAPANGHGNYIASDGRLVFAGAATVDLEVSGDAECDLGPNLSVKAGGELTVYGSNVWVGANGTGAKTATRPLAFVEVGGKVGKVQRFKRRAEDAEPTASLTYALTALRIDVTTPGTYDLGGGAGTGVTFTNPNNITLPAGVTLTDGKLTLTV